MDIKNTRHKTLVTLVKSHASTVSVLDSGEQHYIYIYIEAVNNKKLFLILK